MLLPQACCFQTVGGALFGEHIPSFLPCKEEGLAEHGFGSVLSVLPSLWNEWPEATLVPTVFLGMCPAGQVEEEKALLDPAAACGMVDTST